MNFDVVESAKAILQTLQGSPEVGQTPLSLRAGEQVSEEVACIMQLLGCDPQLMAPPGIKSS